MPMVAPENDVSFVTIKYHHIIVYVNKKMDATVTWTEYMLLSHS